MACGKPGGPARRGAGAADRAGLENRCGRKPTEGSNPSLSALHSDADWCTLAQEAPFSPGFLVFLVLTSLSSILPLSAHFGAVSSAFDARRMAPYSAPLGTTVGTFLGPSVPVAASASAPEYGLSNAEIEGSDERADAWS